MRTCSKERARPPFSWVSVSSSSVARQCQTIKGLVRVHLAFLAPLVLRKFRRLAKLLKSQFCAGPTQSLKNQEQ